MSQLSGGQAARAALAALLLSRFDIVLLDEPTNDLDFDGLERLEDFLDRRGGGLVVVSHDRAFLERIVTSVGEIDAGSHRLTLLPGRLAGLPRGPGHGATPRRGGSRRLQHRTRPAPRPSAPAAAVGGHGRREGGQEARRTTTRRKGTSA